ncbi:MAG: protein kinase domain-containing protein [Planctomycetota bacterium]|jgi:DNA-binding response OmpR family regulator/HEAT repeat protein/tRNA A-37 threonylcarbamoyl transferase component Bud32
MLEQLGEYKVMEKLGEGGMGAVYRGYQESLDREVALKVLSEKLCEDETFVARFQREARAAASLVHPNVIQVFSIGCEQDVHYFAMEYVKGKDLAEHLHEGRKFTLADTMEIMIQVAQAFCCASEIGLIHRDIKPSNIMLDERGIVKITDFGLAKTTDSNLTEVGSIVGTANYMSPEQSQGMALDYRTDFYSLGVVFYELVAGQPPFIAEQPAAVLFKHVYEEPAPPSAVNPDVSPAVDKVILNMMEKKPEDRPGSGEELLTALRDLYNETGSIPMGAVGGSLGMSSSATGIKAVNKASEQQIPSEVEKTIQVQGSDIKAAHKALIVDDVSSVRKLLSTILHEKNYRVSEAENGQVALKKILEENPDLVLLDLGIPELSGFDLLQEMNDKKSSAKVIVLTGQKDPETIKKISEYKISAFLAKPVNIHELRDRIDDIMDQKDSPISLTVDNEARKKSKKKFILVYDTQAYSQHLFRQVLKSEKHYVASVSNRSETIRILEEGLPDLMILSADRDSLEAVELARDIRKRGWSMPIISIIDERDDTARAQLKDIKAEPVLIRPIRLDNFKMQVTKCLDENAGKPSNIKPSGVFETMVHKQEIKDTAFTVFDFAKSLIPIVPDSLRLKYEQTILEKPKGAVCNTIGGILKKHSESHGSNEAMKYIRNAYRQGDFSTRNLCLILLKEILDSDEELEVLGKLITDEDFRIRIRVLNRIGEMKGAKLADLVVRFMNDDVWKVRNAAIDALEDMGPVISFDPLAKYYSRTGAELPDRIRKLMCSDKDPTKLRKIEEMASDKNPATRAFVARILGEMHSKQLITSLINLLKDKHPAVRTAAAESMGRIKSDITLRELFRAITDSNSAVQMAVIGSLKAFKLTAGAKAMLRTLEERKKKIAESASKLLLQLNSNEDHLESILTSLEKQNTESRKYLSLLLSNLIKDEAQLKKIIADLNSKDISARLGAAKRVRSSIK